MSNELFFAPASSQNLTSGFQGEKIGPCGAGRSSQKRASVKTMNGGQQSFLATLEKAARDQDPHQHAASSSRMSSSAGKEISSSGKLQNGCDPSDDRFDSASAESVPPETTANEETSPKLSCENFAVIIRALEAIGFYPPAGASDWQSSAVAGEMDGHDLAALKLLIDRIQQNQSVPAAELKAGFQRLQEFITALLGGNSPSQADGNPGNDLAPDQLSDLVRINQWLQGISSGQVVPQPMGCEVMGQGALDEQSPGIVSAETRSAGPPDNNLPEIKGDYKGDGTLQPAEPSGSVSSAEDRKESDSAKFQDVMPEAKTLNRSEDPRQMSTEADRRQGNGGEIKSESHSHIQPATAGLKPEAGDLSERPIQTSTGQEPVSRVLQESQTAKEGDFKVETGISEEAVGKVLKTEAGTNDGSLFNSAGQQAEKAAETASAPKEAAAGQNNLPTQTLDQIVQRASIHLSSGQHEARIDLKPDFLGQMRMQVVADNHQVTLKILTEHGFVKDMIEHNIHQLKADLQQQGMTIDKLEVSVSRDPDEFGNAKEKLFGSRSRQDAAVHRGHERPADEKPKDPARSIRRADGSMTVDYFA
jgi:flagellar hook-length control protein FliK